LKMILINMIGKEKNIVFQYGLNLSSNEG
jgi:hypothetical protein